MPRNMTAEDAVRKEEDDSRSIGRSKTKHGEYPRDCNCPERGSYGDSAVLSSSKSISIPPLPLPCRSSPFNLYSNHPPPRIPTRPSLHRQYLKLEVSVGRGSQDGACKVLCSFIDIARLCCPHFFRGVKRSLGMAIGQDRSTVINISVHDPPIHRRHPSRTLLLCLHFGRVLTCRSPRGQSILQKPCP